MPEYEFEPVPGLPETLPAGERIVWQGAPDARSLALSAFHLRKLAVYFVVLLALRGVVAFGGGASFFDALIAAVTLAPLALAALALLALFAWLIARTTLYTITTKRVVMRFGVALPMTVNIPFCIVESVALRREDDGNGDIPLTLAGADRIAYLHLWPHARPRHYAHPEPMLRCVPDAERVAALLAQAIAGGAPRATMASTSAAVDGAATQPMSPALS